MLRHLVLDEPEDARGRADGLADSEQIEVLLIPWVVDARDCLGNAVPLLGELSDHEVVLVVARDRKNDVSGSVDPGPLEDMDLRRVAVHDDRAELFLEHLESIAPLLDECHLVAHRDE